MTSALLNEPLVPLLAVPELLPRNMPAPAPTTVLRWVVTGIGGTKLAAVKRGGRWFTTRAALREFMAALNGEPAESPAGAVAG